MRRVIFAVMMLAAVAWAIDQSTPQAEGVAFPTDRHTAGTVGTSVWDRSASGGKADSHKGCPYENSLNLKGRSAKDFLTPDGRFDLKAIRASGYQGPLDLKGLNIRTDPQTGEPVLSPIADARIFSNPDDTFWTDKFSCVNGLDGVCNALCVYDGKLIAGGGFGIANCTFAENIASWDGSSWSSLGSGMNDSVSVLVVYDNKLIAGGSFTTAGGVSANRIASWDGSSWSPLGSGMGGEHHFVHALMVYDNQLIAGGDFTYAGGWWANYIASWDGSSWSPLGSGMGGVDDPYVNALAVYDNNLIVGGDFTTAGGKVSASIAQWTKQYDDVSDDDNEWSLPPDFSLKQNYPNPFNPATTIEFSLPKRGHVLIEIFNLVGQKIRTLVDGYKSAGIYNITWDGMDTGGNPLATGIYFCRFRAGDHVQVKKMVLIK